MRPLLLALVLGPALALAQPAEPAAPPPPAEAPALELPPPPPPGVPPAPDLEAAAALPPDLPPPPPPPPASVDAPWPRFGLLLAAGVPDAAVAALVFRPLPWLRASVGPAWNYLGWGVQAGVGFSPIRWAISPTANLDYGHFFDADASKVARKFGNDNTDLEPLLKRVGYDYWSAQVGLELGSQRGFSFFLRGGLSYFTTTIHGASTAISNSSDPGATQVRVTDPKIRAVVPSAKLGFLIFF